MLRSKKAGKFHGEFLQCGCKVICRSEGDYLDQTIHGTAIIGVARPAMEVRQHLCWNNDVAESGKGDHVPAAIFESGNVERNSLKPMQCDGDEERGEFCNGLILSGDPLQKPTGEDHTESKDDRSFSIDHYVRPETKITFRITINVSKLWEADSRFEPRLRPYYLIPTGVAIIVCYSESDSRWISDLWDR